MIKMTYFPNVAIIKMPITTAFTKWLSSQDDQAKIWPSSQNDQSHKMTKLTKWPISQNDQAHKMTKLIKWPIS